MNNHEGRSAVRVLKSLAITHGEFSAARAYASAQNWNDARRVDEILKATITAQTTSDLAEPTPAAVEFFEAVRAQSVIGRLPGLRNAPLRVRLVNVASGAGANFIGQGRPIKVSALSLEGETMQPKKVGAMLVVSDELVRSSDPASEELLRIDLTAACAQAIDAALLDLSSPGDTATPASILSGVSQHTSTGADVAAITADLSAMAQELAAAGSDLASAAWLLRPASLVYLAGLRDTNNASAFPGLSVRDGGILMGLPVIPTTGLPSPGSPVSGSLALVDGSQLVVASDGQVELASSAAATVEMSDTPTNASDDGTASTLVSLYQVNAVAMRAALYVNWSLRRPYVAVLAGTSY